MKNFWTVFLMIFTLALSTAPAEAKRFGGGKSFGKSHQTTPAKSAPQKREAAPAADKANAAAPAAKSGLMGGMLGGLLAGGLLGYMLGNGAFEGIQFMDILLLGLIVFVVIRLLRGRSAGKQNNAQAAYQTAQANTPREDVSRTNTMQRDTVDNRFQTSSQSSAAREPLFNEIGGFSDATVPMNLPAGFDATDFIAGARDHFLKLQAAWSANDFSTIEEYVSPALHQNLILERQSAVDEQGVEILFVDAELVRADYSSELAELSVKFSGRSRELASGLDEEINDVWHLERDLSLPNRPWLIVGIEA